MEINNQGWSGRFALNTCKISENEFILFGGANVSLQSNWFLFDASNGSIVLISKMAEASKFEI